MKQKGSKLISSATEGTKLYLIVTRKEETGNLRTFVRVLRLNQIPKVFVTTLVSNNIDPH